MTEALIDDCGSIELQTERLTLRALERRDATAIATLINDPAIATMLSRVPHPYVVDDAHDFIDDHGDERVFSLCLKPSGELIGCCGLTTAKTGRRAELGYWIGRPYWGKGHGTEGVQAVIDFGFERMGLEKVDVACRVVNDASRRVIRKCGFSFVGGGMIDTLSCGRVSSEHYVLDRSSWASLKAWGRR